MSNAGTKPEVTAERLARMHRILVALTEGLTVKTPRFTLSLSQEGHLCMTAQRVQYGPGGVELSRDERLLRIDQDLGLLGILELTETIADDDYTQLLVDAGLNTI